jgi:glycerol-3-phosphate acyltransferase PlsX
LLAAQPITFVGNLDARQLFSGDVEVIVCDGFTGNIALKVGESLAELIERMLSDELGLPEIARAGLGEGFERFRRRIDYAERGAAPLLGLAGLALVGHGRSSAQAVESGILMAARLAEGRMVERLAEAPVAARRAFKRPVGFLQETLNTRRDRCVVSTTHGQSALGPAVRDDKRRVG